jgi:hypothetical protein
MFRKREPQSSLFATSLLVPPAKAQRLQASWAEIFRARALPLLEEELFASLYSDDQGRPNRPVQTVLGVLLLKEMFDLTDMEALEHLEFNLLWHHALQLPPEEAHLCQKTLHNFRAGLLQQELMQVAFAAITDRVIGVLGTTVSRQRLDSTHVVGHMAILTRLGLFCETLRVFLSRLAAAHPRLSTQVPVRLRIRYLKDDEKPTAYGDARADQGRRRLAVCARDVYRLCALFRGTAAASLDEYGLLERLLQEQCAVVRQKQRPARDDDDHGEGHVPVVLKDAQQVGSASLQSPHDPEATYSGHKGKGYELQVAETCHEGNAVEIITHVALTDACHSDAQATLPTLAALAERGQLPAELVADTSYGSGDHAVQAQRLGTELVSPVSGPPVAGEAASPPDALTLADFQVDPRPEEPTICPAGHFALGQVAGSTSPERVVLTFDRATCQACPAFARCPVQAELTPEGYRLTVDLVAANLARRRRAQDSGEFRPRYAIRAGIEATHSELKRRHGLSRLRVRGRARILLAAQLKAIACNLKRMVRALMPEPAAAVPATG